MRCGSHGARSQTEPLNGPGGSPTSPSGPDGGTVIPLRVFTPDRVILIHDTAGNEVRRIEASDATPDNTTVFPDAPLQVGSITIIAARDVYA